MNDFTKDELQLIHEYLRGNPRSYVVAEKIQSMIDNYGQHETVLVRGEERLLSEFINE